MPDNFVDEFQLLRGKYIAGLEDQADEIRELWNMLRMFKWSEHGIKTLQQLAHQLTGSGATFGFPDISTSAKVIEDYLLEHQNPAQPIDGREHSLIDIHMANLTGALISASQKSRDDVNQISPVPVAKGHNRCVFIVDGDATLSALLGAYLRSAGFIVKTFASADDYLPLLDQQIPDIILLDPGFPAHGHVTGSALGPAAIYETHLLAGNQLPIILMSSRSDNNARLQTLRAGGAGYLSKPLNLSQLVNTLLAKIEQYEQNKRVMIVDDEPLSTDYHAGILRNHGMIALGVTQPMRSLQCAERFKPDLVILNLYTPDITGLQLAEFLRQKESLSLLPIIFLAKEQSRQLRPAFPDKTLEINGLLTKPVASTFFIIACRDALRETQRMKGRIDRVIRCTNNQQVTRHYLFAAIENELQKPHVTEQLTAIYYIGADPLGELNERYGYTVISELHEIFCQRLASALDGQGQWNAIANLVACVKISPCTIAHHQQQAARIIDALGRDSYILQDEERTLTFSLGIFYIDPNTLSVNDALQKAETAFESAQRSGGNCVMAYGPQHSDAISNPEPELIVDTDEFTIPQTHLPLEQLGLSYQAIVQIKNTSFEHYEILVRRRREDGESISATGFLANVKDRQMRMELDCWILQTAVKAMANESSRQENKRLFLHLPVQTLQQESFLTLATKVIREANLRPKKIVLILDEPWILAQPKQAEALIKTLHAIPCGICLSRAGQSPHSLTLIRRLAFDYVRLAAATTENIGAIPQQQSMVVKLIDAAKNNKSQLIATHVEDARHLSLLWQLGIDMFQGFDIQPQEKAFRHKKALSHSGQSYH